MNLQEYQIDPIVWFSERKLTFEPPHFTRARSPLTAASTKWIVERLRGRYCVVNTDVNDRVVDEQVWTSSELPYLALVPSFEDSQEATFYELTWS